MDKWDYFKNFFPFYIFIYFLNMKPLSKVAPDLLVIQIQIQGVCAQRAQGPYQSKFI